MSAAKIAVYSRILTFLILLFSTCTNGQSWYPLEQNTERSYLYYSFGNYSRAERIFNETIMQTDTINGNVYYQTNGYLGFERDTWYRYSEEEEILYIREDSTDYVLFDFSLPADVETPIEFVRPNGKKIWFDFFSRGKAVNNYTVSGDSIDYVRFANTVAHFLFYKGIGLVSLQWREYQSYDGWRLLAISSGDNNAQILPHNIIYSLCFDPVNNVDFLFNFGLNILPDNDDIDGSIYKDIQIEYQFGLDAGDEAVHIPLQARSSSHYIGYIRDFLSVYPESATMYYRLELHSHLDGLEPAYYPAEGYLEYELK